MNRIGVGFIGAGNFVSATHLPTAQASQIMQIVAIADLDHKRLYQHKIRYLPDYVTTDYTRILRDPSVEVVVIGTKQDLHAEMIIESLNANKHVYCEKPMSQTLEECRAVLAAERRSRGSLAIGFNRRFAPAYRQVRELMQNSPRPWYILYRLMSPNSVNRDGESYYAKQERILYEGSHILDLFCWLLDDSPSRVFMSGDRYANNCAILDFPDGSQACFMCGSLGTISFWKEYLEIFADGQAIAVSDFIDMRVRGIPGEFDRTFAPFRGEHAREIAQYGFDFYETYRVEALESQRMELKDTHGLTFTEVRRPTELPFSVRDFQKEKDVWAFVPDKGIEASLERFAQSCLDGTTPDHADAYSGARSTCLALALLQSLETGQPVNFTDFWKSVKPSSVATVGVLGHA